jgi:hypothetical protein
MNPKSQTPISSVEFRFRNLEFGIFLGFGIWDLGFSFGWRCGSRLESIGLGWRGLRRWRIQAVFEKGSDVPLDFLELVELQIGIDNGENVARDWMFVNENALAIPDNLLFDLEQALSFEHDCENVSCWDVLGIVEFDQFAQQGLGSFFLNGFVGRRRRVVDTMPVRQEAFAIARALAVLLLPAGLADIGTAEFGFIVEQQRVIGLFIGKMSAARFARVGAGLNVPLGHERSLKARVFRDSIAPRGIESQCAKGVKPLKR